MKEIINERHSKPRNALGMRMSPRPQSETEGEHGDKWADAAQAELTAPQSDAGDVNG